MLFIRKFHTQQAITYVGLPIYMREQLTANRTYYVSTTGNDTNNGLSVETSFLTIQKAVDTVCETLDMVNHNVIIQVSDGSYSGNVVLKNYVSSYNGSGVTLRGNVGSPANVVLSNSSGDTISGRGVLTRWRIEGFRISSTGNCITAAGGTILEVGSMIYGSAGGCHLYSWGSSTIFIGSGYSIDGPASRHLLAVLQSAIITSVSLTIVIIGTPTFSDDFIGAVSMALVSVGNSTYSGSAIGRRYFADKLSCIDISYKGTSFIPGSIAGVTTNGSVVI